ncbi:MAG TPA: hypothetical protein VFB21_25995 [Chthonomonadaceae bacterium]|nr:hypothetical protein [Chthonomonadaceae bacterium]
MSLLRLLNTKYNYHGKDIRGVPVCSGTSDAPPIWLPILLVFLVPAVGTILLLDQHEPLVFRAFLILPVGYIVFGGIRYWRLRRQLPRLSSMQNLCTQLNVDGATLQRVAEEQGLKPRYNINGQDFYEITDFGDATTLLRASSASINQRETLLRPAAQTEMPPELLLRASDTKPQNDNQGGK